jgi:hypothetical protein
MDESSKPRFKESYMTLLKRSSATAKLTIMSKNKSIMVIHGKSILFGFTAAGTCDMSSGWP